MYFCTVMLIYAMLHSYTDLCLIVQFCNTDSCISVYTVVTLIYIFLYSYMIYVLLYSYTNLYVAV